MCDSISNNNPNSLINNFQEMEDPEEGYDILSKNKNIFGAPVDDDDDDEDPEEGYDLALKGKKVDWERGEIVEESIYEPLDPSKIIEDSELTLKLKSVNVPPPANICIPHFVKPNNNGPAINGSNIGQMKIGVEDIEKIEKDGSTAIEQADRIIRLLVNNGEGGKTLDELIENGSLVDSLYQLLKSSRAEFEKYKMGIQLLANGPENEVEYAFSLFEKAIKDEAGKNNKELVEDKAATLPYTLASSKFVELIESLDKYRFNLGQYFPQIRLLNSHDRYSLENEVAKVGTLLETLKTNISNRYVSYLKNNVDSYEFKVKFDKLNANLDQPSNVHINQDTLNDIFTQYLYPDTAQNILNWALLLLIKKEPLTENEQADLKSLIENYFDKSAKASSNDGITGIPFDCHKLLKESEIDVVIANIDKYSGTDGLDDIKSDLFLKDIKFKLTTHKDISTKTKNARAKIFEDAKVGIKTNDTEKSIFTITNSNAWDRFCHWLKNLFTSGKTYSLDKDNFRKQIGSFIDSISPEDRFFFMMALNRNGSAKARNELPGAIERAIEEAPSDVNKKTILNSLEEYTSLALEVFDEKESEWNLANPELAELSRNWDFSFNLDQNYDPKTIEGATLSFVKNILLNGSEEAIMENIAYLFATVYDSEADSFDIDNRNGLDGNKLEALQKEIANLPSSIKKAVIGILAKDENRAKLRKILDSIENGNQNGDGDDWTGKWVNSFIQHKFLKSFCKDDDFSNKEKFDLDMQANKIFTGKPTPENEKIGQHEVERFFDTIFNTVYAKEKEHMPESLD